jgi:hypothetical protein
VAIEVRLVLDQHLSQVSSVDDQHPVQDFSSHAADPLSALASDFNGDGMADIGLRDANTGIVFIKHGPSFGDQISYQWATGTNYQPFAADFNGDHLADIGL